MRLARKVVDPLQQLILACAAKLEMRLEDLASATGHGTADMAGHP